MGRRPRRRGPPCVGVPVTSSILQRVAGGRAQRWVGPVAGAGGVAVPGAQVVDGAGGFIVRGAAEQEGTRTQAYKDILQFKVLESTNRELIAKGELLRTKIQILGPTDCLSSPRVSAPPCPRFDLSPPRPIPRSPIGGIPPQKISIKGVRRGFSSCRVEPCVCRWPPSAHPRYAGGGPPSGAFCP